MLGLPLLPSALLERLDEVLYRVHIDWQKSGQDSESLTQRTGVDQCSASSLEGQEEELTDTGEGLRAEPLIEGRGFQQGSSRPEQ